MFRKLLQRMRERKDEKLPKELSAILDGHHAKTETLFKCLSADILNNRKLIGELRGEILTLNQRVWDLEDHTIAETIDKLGSEVAGWTEVAEKFKAEDDSDE